MQVALNFVSIAGLFIGASSLFMATLMFSLGRTRVNTLWGIFCLAVCVWGTAFFFISTTGSPDTALWSWKISHVGVIAIPILFLHFVYVFLNLPRMHALFTLYAIGAALIYIDLNTDLLISGTRFTFGQFYYDTPGVLYGAFVVFFHALIVYGHYLLFRAYVTTKDHAEKTQIRYFFIATIVGFLGGGASFSPVFGLDVYPWSIITVPLYPVIMGYAILHYQLFRIKVVTAQMLAVIIFAVSYFRLFLADSTIEYYLNGALVVISLGLGIYLVRSVMHEVEQREEIERLSQEKSEFMTFASHEIRNPITAMRGLASLIVDGTTGPVPADTRDAAQKILVAGHDVLNIIATYLSKSKMELHQIAYDKAVFDLGEAAAAIAEGYTPHAELKGLRLDITIDRSHKYSILGDQGKVKEVIGNLIDNSLKYTKEGGITVSVERHGPFVRAVISDTGVGIPKETIPQLFKKFSRADAQRVNILGTGIGLYLAKTFIEAQGGRIWAESDGENKGSRFLLEFPAA